MPAPPRDRRASPGDPAPVPANPPLEVATRLHSVAGGRPDAGSGPVEGTERGPFVDLVRAPAGGPDDGEQTLVVVGARRPGGRMAGEVGIHGRLIDALASGRPAPKVLDDLAPLLDGPAVVASLTPIPGDPGGAYAAVVAGRLAAYLLRGDGEVGKVEVAAGGPAATLALASGDSLVLLGDGVTGPGRDRPAASRSVASALDEPALVTVLARCVGFTAEALAERIETAALAFAEDAPARDVVVVVVRVPAPTGSASAVSADLPIDVTAPARARRIVASTLQSAPFASVVDTAVLLASEIVTNAVTHGEGLVRIAVEHGARHVRVSVTDASAALPRRLDLGVDATSGRGVQLLDELADRWGVATRAEGPGKTVWFELDVPGPVPGDR